MPRDYKLIAPTRDTHTNWSTNNPIIPEGVLCYTIDRKYSGSLEYFVGDGVKHYSELEKHGESATYTLPVATSSVLGGVKAGGSNITISDDGVISATDTTYSEATTSAAGLMSTADKTKLDNLQPVYQTIQNTDYVSDYTIIIRDKNISNYNVLLDGSGLGISIINTLGSEIHTNEIFTFELKMIMTETVESIRFLYSGTITWLEEPDFSELGTYIIVFRTYDRGQTFIANVAGRF